ncbi:MAG: hypothetical protein PHQ98_03225 [Candidatus ainarchaeum sp.]|nr:hypothetical protein [Candidatus ainarchaeum sp.]
MSNLKSRSGASLVKLGEKQSTRFKTASKFDTPLRRKRMLQSRRLYLGSLLSIPLINQIFKKQTLISFKYGSEEHSFVLLRTGFKFARFKRPVLIIMNSDGQIMPFYRSTGRNSKLPGKWLPFRGIKNKKIFNGINGEIPIYQKLVTHPNIPSYYKAISEKLTEIYNKLESLKSKNSLTKEEKEFIENNDLEFRDDIDTTELNLLIDYLG